MIQSYYEAIFPKLRTTNYRITSLNEPWYNCIAWAARDKNQIWWPIRGAYWPEKGADLSLDSFIRAFRSLGYVPCRSRKLARGWEKVLIYCDSGGFPTHMARQLPDGAWASKLGWQGHDIVHSKPEGVEGPNPAYGYPRAVMRRRTQRPIRFVDRVFDAFHEIFSH